MIEIFIPENFKAMGEGTLVTEGDRYKIFNLTSVIYINNL